MAQVEYVPDVGEVSEVLVEGALSDPLSALMLVVGSLFILAATAVFGGLSVGGLVSLIVRGAKEQSPRG